MAGCESFTISAFIYVLSFSLISAEIRILVNELVFKDLKVKAFRSDISQLQIRRGGFQSADKLKYIIYRVINGSCFAFLNSLCSHHATERTLSMGFVSKNNFNISKRQLDYNLFIS